MISVNTVIWSIGGLIIFAVSYFEYYAYKTGAPTIASFPAAQRKMIEVLLRYHASDADEQPYQIIDLGSGNGQLATKIAKALPTASVIGLEISWLPWLFSYLRQKIFGPANLNFRRTDFWRYDCSKADVVVTFLTENIIERVSHKLRDELKNQAVVVANDVSLRGNWQPMETVAIGLLQMKLFVYRQIRHDLHATIPPIV